MDLRGKKINFLGDSITYGALTTCPEENCFPTLIGKAEGLAVVRNYGHGGSFISTQLSAEDPFVHRDFYSRAALMDPDADAVVVFGGTNDFAHRRPLGTFEDRNPDTFYGACHTLFLLLLEMYPGKEIVVLTPIHRVIEDCPSKDGDVLADFVQALIDVAGYYGLPVLDLFRTSGIQPRVDFIKERYCPDGLHPNDEGQKLLARRIAGFLKSL